MTDPASSEHRKESIELPAQIGRNRDASGLLLFHTELAFSWKR
jgi:hypothetical protein